MVYTQEGVIKDSKPWAKIFVAGAAAVTLSIAMFASAFATHNSTGCTFDDTTTPGTWSLTADCTTSASIEVPSDTVLDGNGYTISASPTVTSHVLGVTNADNVTVNDLTIDGTNGTALNGINVYVSTDVELNDVTTINNDKYGLVVNGSEVKVDNITTSGNTWGGVNVDLGTNVTTPAILTVLGDSTHSELGQIYLDDAVTQPVTVNDVNNQYVVSNPQFAGRVNDRLYTLKPVVTSDDKNACKNGGYTNFVSVNGVGFKNQGQCVAAAVANENASFKRNGQ